MPETSTLPDTTTSWERYWSGVGNEEYLTARALLQLSADVRASVLDHLTYVPEVTEVDGDEEFTTGGYWRLDWKAWAATIPQLPLSSTGYRLARLVASLTTGATFDLLELTRMGSWETEVWSILVTWGTGGNNRQHPGRAMVVAR